MEFLEPGEVWKHRNTQIKEYIKEIWGKIAEPDLTEKDMFDKIWKDVGGFFNIA
jgi:hypothetical protein